MLQWVTAMEKEQKIKVGGRKELKELCDLSHCSMNYSPKTPGTFLF